MTNKPREFWIKDILNETPRWFSEIMPTTEQPTEDFRGATLVREVVPLDWDKIKKDYMHWPGAMKGDEKALFKIQELVEMQLAGEE